MSNKKVPWILSFCLVLVDDRADNKNCFQNIH